MPEESREATIPFSNGELTIGFSIGAGGKLEDAIGENPTRVVDEMFASVIQDALMEIITPLDIIANTNRGNEYVATGGEIAFQTSGVSVAITISVRLRAKFPTKFIAAQLLWGLDFGTTHKIGNHILGIIMKNQIRSLGPDYHNPYSDDVDDDGVAVLSIKDDGEHPKTSPGITTGQYL